MASSIRTTAKKLSTLTGLAALVASVTFAIQAHAADPSVDQRVDQLLSQMTPAEKMQLLGGVDGFYTREIPRLNIPPI